MSNTAVTIDTTQVDRLFKALTGKQQQQAKIGALRSSARILQKETEIQFKSKIDIDGLRIKYKKKNGKDSVKWKRVATIKVNQKEPSVKVHIMADFRAKFFEMGTKKRRTKGNRIVGEARIGKRIYRLRKGKGGNRGRIQAGWYFEEAQKMTERRIFSNMENEMSKSIIRIAKKYNAA